MATHAQRIHFFLELRNQLKLHHWQTKSYARHAATDKVLEALDRLIDEFVEVDLAADKRPRLAGPTATIQLHNLSEASMVKYLRKAIHTLELLQKPLATRGDLLSIRDDMVAQLNQLLYLTTLH
jgi:hypothetical protein